MNPPRIEAVFNNNGDEMTVLTVDNLRTAIGHQYYYLPARKNEYVLFENCVVIGRFDTNMYGQITQLSTCFFVLDQDVYYCPKVNYFSADLGYVLSADDLWARLFVVGCDFKDNLDNNEIFIVRKRKIFKDKLVGKIKVHSFAPNHIESMEFYFSKIPKKSHDFFEDILDDWFKWYK